ncbi:MAG: alpha/beta fold hydrolase [Chitinispirillaceae bacterium]|nr:alpha/beta fold hydrolase [Chitinispirillaceae bacterium]
MSRNVRYPVGVSVMVIIGALVAGCLKLDPFLFKGRELPEYRFDAYQGDRECPDAVDSLGPVDMTTVTELLLSSGNDSIAAVLIASTTQFDSTDTVIVYFHGTGPHIDYYWPRTRLLAAAGYPVVTVDYRGYGKSSGTPTENGIYEDGYAVQRYIRNEMGDPKIVVYAFSLGTLVGCELASHDTAGRVISLILEAPIGKIATMVQDAAYIDLPPSYILTYEGNNIEKIAGVSVPLLWLHGTSDETNTYETNGKKLYDNYRGPAGYCCIVDDAGHRTIPSTIGYDEYVRGVSDFIRGKASGNQLFSREPK